MHRRLAIVLAAGQGTRMNSELPKVLIEVCGRPMILFVLDALQRSGVADVIVVVGYRAEAVCNALAQRKEVSFVNQGERLGTGHAVQMCQQRLADHIGPVLIVAGDSPLIQRESIEALMELYDREKPDCILGTAHKDDPAGLGRIVRDSNGIFGTIVEEKDATIQQRRITEVNLSTYVFDSQALQQALMQLSNDNRQSEYYITDCPGILKDEGKEVRAVPVMKPCETLSINTFDELGAVEAEMRKMGYG